RFQRLVIVAIGVLILTIAFLLPRLFIRPTPIDKRLVVGEKTAFASLTRPYPIMTDGVATLFIVNTGVELLAFAPYSTGHMLQCRIRWNESRQIFEDACLGTRYTLLGVWCDGPALRNLDRYPVYIIGEQVRVDLSTVVLGDPTAISQGTALAPGCP
ncbi:MAG: hypothetical protein ABI847_18590, partial [Anaerolineales bacterium]